MARYRSPAHRRPAAIALRADKSSPVRAVALLGLLVIASVWLIAL